MRGISTHSIIPTRNGPGAEITSAVVGLGSPILVVHGAAAIFLAFAAMSVPTFFWAQLMLPETRRRSLEDLEVELA